jgi:hypothetical protein
MSTRDALVDAMLLSLCWAVLDVFIPGARGLGLSDLDYHEVVQLKTTRAHPYQAASKVA